MDKTGNLLDFADSSTATDYCMQKSRFWKFFSFKNENETTFTPGGSTYNLSNFRKSSLSEFTTPSLLSRRSLSFSGMDWKKRISSDHTDIAYLEAVNRLRAILSPRPPSAGLVESAHKAYDAGPGTPRTLRSPLLAKESPRFYSTHQLPTVIPPIELKPSPAEDKDLLEFISKQTEYISQLESETKYCRDDLVQMLSKVKDVITENETLHEKQKRETILNSIASEEKASLLLNPAVNGEQGRKSILKKSPETLILQSRVAELEAQMNQLKHTLRSSQEEVERLKSIRMMDMGESSGSSSSHPYVFCDLHRSEIETLSKEKQELLETLSKFRIIINELRERESEAAKKVKKSLDIVESMQSEKSQETREVQRLKEDLERHQKLLKELRAENARKLEDEKVSLENKYRQEIELLNENINSEVDSFARAKIELERLTRLELNLKRELHAKSQAMDELRHEHVVRMGHLQSDLNHSLQAKGQAEQDLINIKLLMQKVERDAKQQMTRLQLENTGLRQRVDAYDSDLIKAQEIIVTQNENIVHLQRANEFLKHGGVITEATAAIVNKMEEKHAQEMAELEKLMEEQNLVLDKLRNECKILTEKLDETSRIYKRDRLVAEKDREKVVLANKVLSEKNNDLEKRVQYYASSHEHLTSRLRKMEEDDKTRAERIFHLLSKQSGLLNENQKLQTELSALKRAFDTLQKTP